MLVSKTLVKTREKCEKNARKKKNARKIKNVRKMKNARKMKNVSETKHSVIRPLLYCCWSCRAGCHSINGVSKC